MAADPRIAQPLAPPVLSATPGTGARAAAGPAPRPVRGGCWLINLTPVGITARSYDGTLRVDRGAEGVSISGDLYARPVLSAGTPPRPVLGPPPTPDTTVPIFPRAGYARHIRVTALDERSSAAGVRLTLEIWQFLGGEEWAEIGSFTAPLRWTAAPPPYPSAADYLEGDVTRANGDIAAHFRMGWLTSRLRRVTVEIDTASGCEQPVDNGAGYGWRELFDALNWDGSVLLSDRDVAEPASGSWSDAALQAAMHARRDRNDLDAEWRYHILSVGRIMSSERGVMYDNRGTDAGDVPREGCAVAARWPVPDAPPWGLSRGQRFGACRAPFFRAAVHELGHAFGLVHNADDLGFMNTTEVIAAAGTATQLFPGNIRWAFSPRDLRNLRHMPDILVRPGGALSGLPFEGGVPPVLADAAVTPVGLTLEVAPLRAEVPIGAPVRARVTLRNTGDSVQRVPARISLKTEFLRGRVIDPAGTARTFRSLLGCIEDRALRDLDPGDALSYDITLLRGMEGALFPAPGLYRIVAELCWTIDADTIRVAGEASLFVTGARSAGHAAAAHRVLATPELHLVLALGGDHLDAGIAALESALADRVLRPHFAAIEARRRAVLTADGRKDAGRYPLGKSAVLSASEAAKLRELGVTPARGRRPRKRPS